MLKPAIPSPGRALRERFARGIVVLPGVYNALTAVAAARCGAEGLYLSGGAVSNSLLGAPDIALTTLDEVARTAAACCQAAGVPILADADTGFGDVWNTTRTVIEFERAGLAGLHLEDQASPKRCGHLDGKELIGTAQMQTKIRAAVEAKRDPAFLVMARTDARGVEGLDAAIARAKAYADAGADAIFPEGLESEHEFEAFRRALDPPLLANMTEFGKTPLIPASRFGELGYQMVIFPVTALRVTLRAVEDFYTDLLATGTQAGWLDRMRTRAQLYETIEYDAYNLKEKSWLDQSR